MGVQCIVDLFNLIPYMREHFKTVIADSGRMDPDDDAAMQAMLENHAKLVMNIVHQVVINIDDLDLISPKLFRIGVFHKNTGIVPRYLDIMGPVFCNAVRPILLKHRMWRAEIEDSWMEVFKVIRQQGNLKDPAQSHQFSRKRSKVTESLNKYAKFRDLAMYLTKE